MFTPVRLGAIEIPNRVVMAPMTRSRANPNAEPGPLHALYYQQRASAGLIITEGTAPSADGLGYARTPAIYTEGQIAGWKLVTGAVHKAGGRIVLQLMHVGRIAHPLNQPAGARIVAPSAVTAKSQMWTDSQGMQPVPSPAELTDVEIRAVISDFANAAGNARLAGFDGVELHGANGYLVNQFLSTNTNQRTGPYGGSVENRARFAIETIDAMSAAWESGRIGIRVSPGGSFNDMQDDDASEMYPYLARQLSSRALAYLHVVRPAPFHPSTQAFDVVAVLRDAYRGALIVNGGLDLAEAKSLLNQNLGDAFSFGRPFIANPDLPEVLRKGVPLAQADHTTFYTPGDKGYTDYPRVAG